jgi:Zn-dependent protease
LQDGTYAQPKVEMRVDRQEAFDIIVSVLAIALVFTFYDQGLAIAPSTFVFYMAAAVVTLGSGFVLHELAHKYFAIRYGARARFVAWPVGLALALVLVIVPQLIFGWSVFLIAPGAVYIYAMRPISIKENGIISLAGPVTNILLSLAFLAALVTFQLPLALSQVLAVGFRVNAGLALFNLIPFFPLDGSKVIAWDWKVWLAAVVASFFLMSIPGMLAR